MKRTWNISRTLLFSTAALLGAAACGGSSSNPPPEEGNAYLTVVGDRNVFLDHDAAQRLSIRYHDSQDQPLAGEVSFRLVGDAKGSSISKDSGVTNSQGIVELQVEAGAEDANFRIEATAEYASSADWSIAVTDGGSVPPLDPQGTYKLDSRFDVSQPPGDVGEVVGKFIEITDDPYDPATWLLDQIDDVPGFLRPGLDAVVNEVMTQYAPNFVNNMVEIGDRLGQAAKKFGTVSELVVTSGDDDVDEGSRMAAVHTMTGFTFRIDGDTYEFSVDELGSEEPSVEDITFDMSSEDVTVGAHDMPVRYGGFLALALEDVIIPLVDGNAASLHELFQNQVNCVQVGQELYSETQFFSPSFWEGACDIALQAAAESIMAEVVGLDEQAPLLLQIQGEARALDNNGDRQVDALNNGKWSGTLDFNGDVGELSEPGSFTGELMSGSK